MVDRKARDQYAELLRHSFSGHATEAQWKNFQYELGNPTADRSICEIDASVGLLEEDVFNGASKRWELSREARREAARYMAFLYTDFEYEWPRDSRIACLTFVAALGLGLKVWIDGVGVSGFLLGILIVAAGYIPQLLAIRSFNRAGDHEVWPFLRREDFEEARRHPRLLAGNHPRS